MASELERAGRRMYRQLGDKMRKQAYGTWDTMMYEYVVRVCTIQYYRRYGTTDEVERALKYQIDRGFAGMYELDEIVSEYEKKHDRYATFESFFPRAIEFFDGYSKTFDSDLSIDNWENANDHAGSHRRSSSQNNSQ